MFRLVHQHNSSNPLIRQEPIGIAEGSQSEKRGDYYPRVFLFIFCKSSCRSVKLREVCM